MEDSEIVKIAAEHRLCTIVPDAGYKHDALWFDANLIEFSRAIELAVREEVKSACGCNGSKQCAKGKSDVS